MCTKKLIASIQYYANDIETIFQDLKSTLRLSYFCYTRVNRDRTFSTLASNPEWMGEFYLRKYYNIGVDSLLPQTDLPFKLILWDIAEKTPHHKMILDELRKYHIYNLCTLIKMNKEQTYLYHFGMDRDNLFNNQIYLNNEDTLKLFTYVFQEKLHLNKTLLSLSKGNFKIDPTTDNEQELDSATIKTLEPLKRYYISDDTYLTRREVESIQAAAEGYSSRDIAHRLHISTRTVEKHIFNVKEKLQCQKMIEIIQLLIKQHIIT